MSSLHALVIGMMLTSSATKATGIDDPAKALTQHGLVAPWESSDKHDTAGKVAEFKYRYKSREGHMMDAAPTLSSQTVKVSSDSSFLLQLGLTFIVEGGCQHKVLNCLKILRRELLEI